MGDVIRWHTAGLAQSPGQSLRDDQVDRRRYVKRRDSHIEQPGNGFRGTVGV